VNERHRDIERPEDVDHPDYRDRKFDLSGERAIVIGNGNVAVDVARMLTLTHAELAATDTAGHAIEAFGNSRIRELVILRRRGPQQAAFTAPSCASWAS
jgi:ferredoxin--NADP+ reductase